ncbi:hypothetical protein DFH11DRAFT_1566191 [Phellopilus nigrolimitatus]|nr:hypothetical protein DFH11DRAFT_1566191 [Phellopilus nigrolimitatus]
MSVDFRTAVEQETRRLQVIHPTPEQIPGCMSLLDDFLSCNALGFQLKSLYRYGGQAVCGRKMEDFKFCMSLKSLDQDEKREAWIRRRAEWWATRRLAKSSEDVWDMRTEPLQNFPPKQLIRDLTEHHEIS